MIGIALEDSLPRHAVDDKTDLHIQTVSRGINWIFAITIVGFHLGAIAALLYFRWSGLVVFLVIWILTQNQKLIRSFDKFLAETDAVWPGY
jgi:hypothetical protein